MSLKRKPGIVSVSRACFLCKKDHKACNGARPCARCISLEVPEKCEDVALKPRGRPRKMKCSTTTTTTTSTTTTTNNDAHNHDNVHAPNLLSQGASLLLHAAAATASTSRKKERHRHEDPHKSRNGFGNYHDTNNSSRRDSSSSSRRKPSTGYVDHEEASSALVYSFPFSTSSATTGQLPLPSPSSAPPKLSSFPWPYPSSPSSPPSSPYSSGSGPTQISHKKVPEAQLGDVQHLCHRFKILQHKVQHQANGLAVPLQPITVHPSPHLPLHPTPIHAASYPEGRSYFNNHGDEEHEEASGWRPLQRKHSPPCLNGLVQHNTQPSPPRSPNSLPHQYHDDGPTSSPTIFSSSLSSSSSSGLGFGGLGAFLDYKLEGRKRRVSEPGESKAVGTKRMKEEGAEREYRTGSKEHARKRLRVEDKEEAAAVEALLSWEQSKAERERQVAAAVAEGTLYKASISFVCN